MQALMVGQFYLLIEKLHKADTQQVSNIKFLYLEFLCIDGYILKSIKYVYILSWPLKWLWSIKFLFHLL